MAMKTAEQMEWERAAGAGRSRARKRAVPLVAGLSAGALVAVVAFVVMGRAGEANEADKQARLARGETVIEVHARGVDPHVGSGITAIVLPSAAGLGAFLAVFFLLGGRLSAEYKRGLSDLAR